MKTHTVRYAAAFAGLFLSAGLASAEPITVDIVGLDPSSDAVQASPTFEVDADSDGFFAANIGERPAGPLWKLDSLTLSGETDPIANLGFAVTNTASIPVEFIFTMTVPIAPPLPASFIGGSASFTLTDADFSGDSDLSSNGAGDPGFVGLIDGVPALSLFDAPFTISTPAGSVSDFEVLGLPGPTIPSGPALTSIGIEVNFSLSPGDSASGTFSFVVEIPEPSSALIAVSGLAIGVFRRR